MDPFIDILNLIFLFVGLYFTILFIFLFSENKKRMFRRPDMKKFPSVTVLIPAYNEEKTIGKTIEKVKKMIYPKKKEIIVIDDGSKDRTARIVEKIRGVKLIKKRQGGKASALNVGLKKAKGEILVCIDSDSYPDRNALMRSIPFFQDSVAAVTTTVLVKNKKSIIEKMQELEYIFIAWSRKIFEYLNSIYVTPGPMSLYRRDVLLKVGGFDSKNMTEDIEIAWRLMSSKYKIQMALDSKVTTNVPNTLVEWWHQRIRWNVGGLQTFFKYFHLFLDRGIQNIGLFLLPLFSLAYFVCALGLLFVFYVTFNAFRYLVGVYTFGFSLIGPIYFIPSMFWFFGVLSIVFTFLFIRINFRTMDQVIDVPKKALSFFVYLFIYTLIVPFNLLHSVIKFLNKSYKW
jgi:cellulose synthase/poly-beta-1,6-N-acetylglucosamine synthase-like glycosyltransferase